MSPVRRQRPRRAITGRALVLGALVVVLVVVLAAPVHRYFQSRNDVHQAAQQLRQDKNRIAALQTAQAQWADPGYVASQARQRLQYAMPGDTTYIVVRRGEQNGVGTAAPVAAHPAGSWNQRIWDSLKKAGAAG